MIASPTYRCLPWLCLLVLLLMHQALGAQVRPERFRQAMARQPQRDSLAQMADTTLLPAAPRRELRLSPDSLDAPVRLRSRDSMYLDVKNKMLYVYGEGQVDYTTITLKADLITFDFEAQTVTAEGRTDSLGRTTGLPDFKNEDQSFTARRMRFNFETMKGIVYDARTMQQGVHVHSKKAKFIGARDTLQDDIIYNQDALFTTCDLPHPHFGIHSKKQMLIPNKLVIVGPSNLEIADIPTPLWLPFGFFPLTQGKRTGLIFPRDYEYSDQWGFGLRNVGWYFPISDYWDLTLTGDIYLKGTWGINAHARYRKRYKHNGSLTVGYARRRVEVEGVPRFEPSMTFRWSHNQDASAHPYQSFGGSINIQTNNFQRVNRNDAQSVLQSQLTSNLSWSRRFDGPYNLSVNFTHSQNTNTRQMTISFPNINFQTQTLYPFRRKNRVGPERWYERFNLRYTGEARNTFTAQDTSLFRRQTLQDARYGVRHTVSSSASFNVFKYFQVGPNVSYKEVWYFNTIRKEFTFDPDTAIQPDTLYNPDDSTDFQIVYDTLNYGTVRDIVEWGLKPLRQFHAGFRVGTNLFGTVLFQKGRVRGLRHLMKPSVSFNYSPDYTNPGWGYFDYVQTDIRDPDALQRYTIFEQGIFDKPSASGRQMAISYNISNTFEGKFWSRRDSTVKKVSLLRSLNVSGSYNFAADSLRWTPVRMSGNTAFFNGITTLSFGAEWDPYQLDADGRKIDRFYFDQTGKPLRFVQATAALSTRMTVQRLRDLFRGIHTDEAAAQRPPGQERPQEEDLLSLFENFSISHQINVRAEAEGDSVVTKVTIHNLSMRGNVQLTPNWSLTVGNIGYDFVSKRITYPDLGFYRNLHCWEMGFNWQPLRGTYSFFLRVKPGALDFINIPYSKNNVDAAFSGF